MKQTSFSKFLNTISSFKNSQVKIDNILLSKIQNSLNSKLILRPYQEKALMTLDWFFKDGINRKSILDQIKDEKRCGDVPILTFESATGSGKTLLMGAMINYLREEIGAKNFLILTPPNGKSAIYEKTINNFNFKHKKCILNKSLSKNLNIITGENYTNKTCEFDKVKNTNVFILNISKFFENKNNIKSIDKIWEESFWKDNKENTISFRDYLKKLEDLVIITDESHHFQKFTIEGDKTIGNKGNSSADIVKDLKPKLLIELSATCRDEQKPIFRYSINDFINDKYGKKIRAWGINTKLEENLFNFDKNVLNSNKDVTNSDVSKLIRSIAVHLIKKKALNYDGTDRTKKPILLIKARNTEHAEKLKIIIDGTLPKLEKEIKVIFENIIKDKDFEINKLIKNEIKINDLEKEIKSISEKTFTYHTKNESKVNSKIFEELEENEFELVIQVEKATEGWDINNVYTILILSNNEGKIKTNVKQLIGRGLRLNKNQREFDENIKSLQKEQELLHIICDQGNNFEKFINQIRNELGLNEENLRTIIRTRKVLNTIRDSMKDLLENLKLPLVKKQSKTKITDTKKLVDKINYSDLKLDKLAKNISNPWQNKNNFLASPDETHARKDKNLENVNVSCHAKKRIKKYILKWNEEDRSKESDIITGKNTKDKKDERESSKLNKLIIDEYQIKKLVNDIISDQYILPYSKEVKNKFKISIEEFLNKNEFYYKTKYATKELWNEKVIKELYNHISYIIDNLFEENFDFYKNINLNDIFNEYEINLELSKEKHENIKRKEEIHNILVHTKKEIPKYFITGFHKSLYSHNKFDSSHELKFAELIDESEDVEFWIKNKSTKAYELEYDLNKKFNPDFIIKLKDDERLHIFEIKGEGLLDISDDKIKLIKKINDNCPNIQFHFYIDSSIDRMHGNYVTDMNRILNYDNITHL